MLIAMLLHATNNAVGGNIASQLFTGDDLSRLGWLTAAAWWAAAGLVLVLQARNASRRRRALEGHDVELGESTDRRDHSIVG